MSKTDPAHYPMRVAYIAHPVGGDVENNLKRIEKIGRQINLEEPEVVPFAPYYFDCHALDDSIPTERDRGIKNNIALIRKGVVDEVRLYGNRISTGMGYEIKLAHELGIPVIPMTPEAEREYIQLDQITAPCQS